MPVFSEGAPRMRNEYHWESSMRRGWRFRAYQSINEKPGDGKNDPQLDWDLDGSMIVRKSGHKIVRGVVLIDVLDVDNANLNGWFTQPRATTAEERDRGLIRVQKV